MRDGEAVDEPFFISTLNFNPILVRADFCLESRSFLFLTPRTWVVWRGEHRIVLVLWHGIMLYPRGIHELMFTDIRDLN